VNLNKFKYKDKRGERADILPKLNRSALARGMDISRSQLSRILNGRVEPPVKTLRKMAEVLDATLDEVDEWLRELKGENGHG